MDREQLDALIDDIRKVRHDANGPLTVALGHIQLLDSAGLDDETRSSLATVESELRRLIDILRRLDQVRDTLRQASADVADPP